MTRQRDQILEGIAAGAPLIGPSTVHIDVTNACNAACITCWDHSPLLDEPRPISWKKQRLERSDFERIVDQLEAIGSVQSVILSGMGDPLVHPDIYQMIQRVKRAGWHVTVLSNLIAADITRLAASGVDQVLAGVHGATPRSYAAFHPGWAEMEFATLCRYLRVLHTAGVATRHVHVINRDNVHEIVDMVQLGHRFGADRVNFKLASLFAGTEQCGITAEQRDWLHTDGIARARSVAEQLGVACNLDLFAAQIDAARSHLRATTPIDEVGCFMGYLYTRITVDQTVLYCCNTQIQVGSLVDDDFSSLWFGPSWQALRTSLRAGHYLTGCDKCGKFEQNVKWSQRFRRHVGDDAWRRASGRALGAAPPSVTRTPPRLRVVK